MSLWLISVRLTGRWTYNRREIKSGRTYEPEFTVWSMNSVSRLRAVSIVSREIENQSESEFTENLYSLDLTSYKTVHS